MTAKHIQEAWDKLRQERDELAARVEVMQEALRSIARDNRPYTMAQNASDALTTHNTAAAILRQRDVRTLREASKICRRMALYTGLDCADVLSISADELEHMESQNG